MAPEHCSFCGQLTNIIIKSKISEEYICFDCVDGVGEILDLAPQKVIKIGDYKK